MDSKLQIISGKYKGRKLAIPIISKPTQNKTRIAIFNMLESLDNFNFQNLFVWDVFAGSGAFGLECLSRYNAKVLLTDISKEAEKILKINSKNMNNVIIKNINALKLINEFSQKTNLFFLDPPYKNSKTIIDFINKGSFQKNTIIIIETNKDTDLKINNFNIIKEKIYSNSKILFYRFL